MGKKSIADFISELVNLDYEVQQLEFPIDFKDPQESDVEMINTYNKYLAEEKFNEAVEYRKENPELESYIFDATKMNYLQTLLLSIHNAAGITYLNDGTKANNATSVQVAIDTLDSWIKTVQSQVNDCFSSVSSGKKLLASAITDKGIKTDEGASFNTMATNINKISTGKGNAEASHVIKGKTFTNAKGYQTGSMESYNQDYKISKSYMYSNTSLKHIVYNIPVNKYYGNNAKFYSTYSDLAEFIGLTQDKIPSGQTILGIKGTAILAPQSQKQDKKYYGKVAAKTSHEITYVFDTAFSEIPKNITVSITSAQDKYNTLTIVEQKNISTTNVSKTGFTLKFTTSDYGSEIIPDINIAWSASV